MTSTIEPDTSANLFRSTYVYGHFANFDNSSSSIPARAAFQRDILVGGNLFLGNGKTDTLGAFLDSSSNIQFTLNNEIVSVPVKCLDYIKNLTSDVQQQIQDLSNNEQILDLSFNDLSINGFLNGLMIKNYGNGNTSFSTGNTDILGSSNSRFGYFTGYLSGYSNAVFGDQSLQNCTGHSNTAIGHNSQNGNKSYNYNTSIGSDSNITGGSSNIAIGHGAQCTNCYYSVAIGINATCNTSNQILLGNSSHTAYIPGNLSCDCLISANVINTSGNLYCNGILSANRLSTSGDLTCNGLLSDNRLSATGNITFSESLNSISTQTFSYLSGVTSSIQDQINNSSTAFGSLNSKTIDISWISGTVNRTDIRNACSTNILTFSQSLNNISTTTFGYLSGVTSSIQDQINTLTNNLSEYVSSLQNQINALSNNTPAGMVIAFAGSSSTLSGYLLCDGSIYNSANYNALFNAIGTIYGDAGNGNFRVPDYRAVFLRGAGQQYVYLQVIAGGGGPIMKRFIAPTLGRTVIDQSTYFSTSNYVDSISTTSKTVVTGSSINIGTLSTTSVIGSVNYSTTNNFYNLGNQETHPVHASVNYFIKT